LAPPLDSHVAYESDPAESTSTCTVPVQD